LGEGITYRFPGTSDAPFEAAESSLSDCHPVMIPRQPHRPYWKQIRKGESSFPFSGPDGNQAPDCEYCQRRADEPKQESLSAKCALALSAT
jgi:hypothetical protein